MVESKKYNRTFHFPFSPGGTDDDKRASSISTLVNIPIVITEKMDGSNTSLEHNGCYARTHSSLPTHSSFDGFKSLHASIKYKIPEGIQLFGEWLYARHSIGYTALPGYFLLFNVRDLTKEKPIWYSWDEVELWAEEIGVPTVPILFKGIVSSDDELEKLIQSLMSESSLCGGYREGVVARVSRSFNDDEFSTHVMKCVRKNHVQTSEHWRNQIILKNKLREKL